MEYKLINFETKEETICQKIQINKFDYYVNKDIIKLNDPITDGYRVWFWRDDCSLLGRKKIIATNNSHISIPKVIDKIEEVIKNHFYQENGIDFKRSTIGAEEFIKGLKIGYNKSQETHPFSKKDMIEFVEWIIEKYISYNDVYITKVDYYYSEAELKLLKHYSTEELLELWKEQQPKVLYYDSK
jgi:hypothetical protein